MVRHNEAIPADDRQVTGDEPYKVQELAKRHGLTTEEARDLMKEYGTDRNTLDRAAEQMHRSVVAR
ncbi:MAG: hypothetical protein JWO51_2835 [Rhodospirillales bacterium]|nr:hypothetical protein [Rhodospirillales bacterium]